MVPFRYLSVTKQIFFYVFSVFITRSLMYVLCSVNLSYLQSPQNLKSFKDNAIGITDNGHGKNIKCAKNFGWKTLWKEITWRPRHRWEGNTKLFSGM
jgi:hypothetical protein